MDRRHHVIFVGCLALLLGLGAGIAVAALRQSSALRRSPPAAGAGRSKGAVRAVRCQPPGLHGSDGVLEVFFDAPEGATAAMCQLTAAGTAGTVALGDAVSAAQVASAHGVPPGGHGACPAFVVPGGGAAEHQVHVAFIGRSAGPPSILDAVSVAVLC